MHFSHPGILQYTTIRATKEKDMAKDTMHDVAES